MPSVRTGSGGRGRALLAAMTMFVAAGATAEPDDGCVWFPDLRCEGREARPDGSFNPMGMPYLFEDPHITSGLNFAYLWHGFPDDSAFQGGGVHVLALQIRLALTDRLAFIATKDGLTIRLWDGEGKPLAELGVLEEYRSTSSGLAAYVQISPDGGMVLLRTFRGNRRPPWITRLFDRDGTLIAKFDARVTLARRRTAGVALRPAAGVVANHVLLRCRPTDRAADRVPQATTERARRSAACETSDGAMHRRGPHGRGV